MNGRCCSCGHATTPVLDLGEQHIPDFTAPGTPAGERYPLRLQLCQVCTLLQLDDLTPRDVLYHQRYGFKSGVNEAVRTDLAGVARYALAAVPHPGAWLDIASNDGTLLSFVPAHIDRTGVDPLPQMAIEAKDHADRIVVGYFASRYFQHHEFDVITSVSMFYDLADPNVFVRGVRDVLARDGVWVIQQNYAADMVTSNAVDNICHEHVTYFTVAALSELLSRHGLEISDVTYSAVNGGCVRTLVNHQGQRPVNPSVAAAVSRELALGLHQPATYTRWGAEVRAELGRTRELLDKAAASGERVYLYGASTRGGTFLQMIGAGPDVLPYAVERNPAKVGTIMSATGIPIISEEEMRADPPDYLLVSPWFFRDVFVAREKAYLDAGGAMVFPLPVFEVVRW